MKRLSTQFVREELKKQGYVLHGEYVNAKKLMDITCPVGHRIKKAWHNMRFGCPRCAGKHVTTDIRLIRYNYKQSIEEILQHLQQELI